MQLLDQNSCYRNDNLRSVAIICGPFVISLGLLGLFLLTLPELPEEHRHAVKFPKDLAELKTLGYILSSYKGNYYWQILLFITAAYIFLQSFMIPGSVFFSVLLGYLFPFPMALMVIALCSAVGASCCYLLAGYIGSKTLLRIFPEQIRQCRKATHGFEKALFVGVFLLRLCPFIPNWLVNIASPIINIPIGHFFWGTFVGVMPLSLVFIKAGTMLQELTDLGVTSLTSVYTLLGLGVVSLLPFMFTRQLKEKFL